MELCTIDGLKLDKFEDLKSTELEEVNGGGAGAVIAVVVVICVIAFAVGVYNGYQDNKK
ncbi:class IIb bacteriocin, lactobin A/cerein 7B family [Cellulosilyticum lentocellum]|uniref:Class IIb bacteriocin, lactobin A/cerein 7B family n=1 Tax=Cellulosilyticum lentocellum (strain ATCC 49066 / DSM 5427 / NCIMB 11756 / RHM5) TaxID=642492 RepID=F2JGE9_CELLD|nr:class IIb bacteriocin, lactobin A/cerein 7B family [Cellulosilyticum lentocellum]ADZ81844.1 hypothetical protein Clole_0084 [Cellulosilyticum lentocellum DSM 5427]